MSILKGILHHWNKTSSAYDTIHPETEVAQVTNWNQGIVNTLASTALGTLVSTLTSDSLLATMIQKVLTATGVKYNIAKNGYLCFGSLFGGLIIQWGISSIRTAGMITAPLPITVNSVLSVAVIDDVEKTEAVSIGQVNSETTGSAIAFSCASTCNQFRYMAICI